MVFRAILSGHHLQGEQVLLPLHYTTSYEYVGRLYGPVCLVLNTRAHYSEVCAATLQITGGSQALGFAWI
jgi:hypothetical protein